MKSKIINVPVQGMDSMKYMQRETNRLIKLQQATVKCKNLLYKSPNTGTWFCVCVVININREGDLL